MRTLRPLLIDALAVVLFAAIGRASHGEELSVGGLAGTAWPFLVAVVVGWVLASRLGGGSWWREGLITWAATVGLGMALRVLAGQGAAPGFVVVTSLVLGVFLLGWRWVGARVAGRT